MGRRSPTGHIRSDDISSSARMPSYGVESSEWHDFQSVNAAQFGVATSEAQSGVVSGDDRGVFQSGKVVSVHSSECRKVGPVR